MTIKKKATLILILAVSLLFSLLFSSCQATPGKDGKSAYELAVENGFQGTLDEWLESLKGADGQNGKDGKNGENGIDGKNGVDGKDGRDGVNGEDGRDGKNGQNGGEDAYDVAVRNGFDGTYEQWEALVSVDDPYISEYVIITDYIHANTGKDVSNVIQEVIRDNPNKTIFFPDGVYTISKPILTPAAPSKSVSLKLSNYAIIRASNNWTSREAMIRLGGKNPENNINSVGSNYFLEGGIIDGNGVAKGISIDSGRETRISNVSIKNTVVGLHIKEGVNNGSADADIYNVNIVGTNTDDSVGVLIEAYDNTLDNMRIAKVKIGVQLNVGGNFLSNIHPLFINSDDFEYSESIGFWNKSGANWFDTCYSDQFATGFLISSSHTVILDKCYCFWYETIGNTTAYSFSDKFNGTLKSCKAAFRSDCTNSFLSVASTGGSGIVENPLFDKNLNSDNAYVAYLQGKIVW